MSVLYVLESGWSIVYTLKTNIDTPYWEQNEEKSAKRNYEQKKVRILRKCHCSRTFGQEIIPVSISWTVFINFVRVYMTVWRLIILRCTKIPRSLFRRQIYFTPHNHGKTYSSIANFIRRKNCFLGVLRGDALPVIG